MTKTLIGYGKPAFREGMTEEEKKKAIDEYTKSLILEIQKKTTMFSDISEDELSELVDEALQRKSNT